MLNRDKMLNHLSLQEERLIAAQALDKAETILRGQEIAVTNFLNPHQIDIVEKVISQIAQIKYRFFGGFAQSERQRLVMIPEYMIWEMVKIPLAYLEIIGKFDFQPVSHRDYLGSCLALGLRREMFGDILLQANGAQLIVVPEIVESIKLNLKRIHQVSVTVIEITEEQLILPEERVKEINTTIASLRLDAVASAGFSKSRTKMAQDIKMEKVKVNFKTVTNPARLIAYGDVISIRGRGRVEIKNIAGETRKGRIKLCINRYL